MISPGRFTQKYAAGSRVTGAGPRVTGRDQDDIEEWCDLHLRRGQLDVVATHFGWLSGDIEAVAQRYRDFSWIVEVNQSSGIMIRFSLPGCR